MGEKGQYHMICGLGEKRGFAYGETGRAADDLRLPSLSSSLFGKETCVSSVAASSSGEGLLSWTGIFRGKWHVGFNHSINAILFN